MDWSWITTTWTAAAMSALSAIGVYAVVVLYTRIGGLRSFSKMSSFDFAITVAIGSVIATTVVAQDPPLLQGALALAWLYALQYGLSQLRQHSTTVRTAVDNRPVLLMDGDRMLEAAMDRAGVTRSDILAKLREANVLRFDQVRAVVLESTGDISVLHAPADDPVELEDALLEEVRGA